jgi:hypothetical protein
VERGRARHGHRVEAAGAPVNVYLASDLIGFRTEFRSPPGHFGALPVVQLVGRPMSGWDSVIKSLEDYVLASILVVASAPLLLAIAVAIKLDSRGPVLFRQKRLGFNNQVIDVYKFRSMHADAGAGQRPGRARRRRTTPASPASAGSCGAGAWTSCRSCSTC